MINKQHDGSGVAETDKYWGHRNGGAVTGDVRKDGSCMLQRTTDGKGGEPWVRGCCTFDGKGDG